MFINPPRDLIELSLISYMLYYQDNRNRAQSNVQEPPVNNSINSMNAESKHFFNKMGVAAAKNDILYQKILSVESYGINRKPSSY